MKNCLLFLSLVTFLLFESCDNQQASEVTDTTTIITKPDTQISFIKNNPTIEVKKHFKCSGNEPFWTLNINDTLINFYEDALEKNWKFPFQTLRVTGKYYTYRSSLKKNNLTVKIVKDNCEDDMSGEAFEYAVEILKNGNRFTGCCQCLNDTLK